MDISHLREPRDSAAFTVSEINNHIKSLIESDYVLKSVTVSGEISNFIYHRSGHLYFTLKDDYSQIKAVMFKSSALKLKFVPENGMKVIVKASVGVYNQGGAYQLYVTSIQPDGIGSLYLAFEQLKAKLSAEGLFDKDNKKALPYAPLRVGVITSPSGAAVRDIINVTGRRFPLAEIFLYPSLVQGDGASENLIEALDYFISENSVEVIIIGRGGGSIEDLWAFNSEALARKIYDCPIPVISAVGHETDFTICDFVADMRAPTPSAAAEIAVPDFNELLMRLSSLDDRVLSAVERLFNKHSERLALLSQKLSGADALFLSLEDRIERNKIALAVALEKIIEVRKSRLSMLSGKLDALSPLGVLKRGYSIAYANGSSLKSINEVSINDKIKVKLVDGVLDCAVLNKE